MKILVVVDMQNDFIDGALGTREAMDIVTLVKAKIDRYLSAGDTVIFTKDTHSKDYLQTQEGKRLPVEHCVKGTLGWEISQSIYVDGCQVIEKPTFGSIELSDLISKMKEIESIELIGICTDICVISNAIILKAKMPEITIRVDASCCAGTTYENHRNALNAMRMCQVEIIE